MKVIIKTDEMGGILKEIVNWQGPIRDFNYNSNCGLKSTFKTVPNLDERVWKALRLPIPREKQLESASYLTYNNSYFLSWGAKFKLDKP